MTHDELRNAAINYLVQVFTDQTKETTVHVVQAAVSVALSIDPKHHGK